ncbi:MAG: GtrA family protein [Firmicutes bacterium]|nr:GtrA family protein [Bacillota bacterium]MBQ4467346.1 GtrA family protein [Bacillota bacterium]MCR4709647.1 GtrA family protein [Clostridiales bacterium]
MSFETEKIEETQIPDQHLSKKENTAQVIKFTLFSISAGIIETLSFTLLNEVFHLPYMPCYLTALILSVIWNFTLNREFTFKSANNVPLAMLKVACFYLVFTPLSTWWGTALTNAGWNEYIVLFGTMAVNLTTEFLYDRFFVFRGTMNTNKRAQKEREHASEEVEGDE